MYNDRTIGQTLKLLMLKDDINNENKLAEEAELNQPTIHRILTGESKEPKISVLKKLAKHFNITVSQLIGEQPIPRIDAGDTHMVNDDYPQHLTFEQRKFLDLLDMISDRSRESLFIILSELAKSDRHRAIGDVISESEKEREKRA